MQLRDPIFRPPFKRIPNLFFLNSCLYILRFLYLMISNPFSYHSAYTLFTIKDPSFHSLFKISHFAYYVGIDCRGANFQPAPAAIFYFIQVVDCYHSRHSIMFCTYTYIVWTFLDDTIKSKVFLNARYRLDGSDMTNIWK